MRTARDVIARWIAKDHGEAESWDFYLTDSDSLAAALRADGLVIVAEADVTDVSSWAEAVRDQIGNGYCGYIDTRAVEAVDRLDAALAAGGNDGN